MEETVQFRVKCCVPRQGTRTDYGYKMSVCFSANHWQRIHVQPHTSLLDRYQYLLVESAAPDSHQQVTPPMFNQGCMLAACSYRYRLHEPPSVSTNTREHRHQRYQCFVRCLRILLFNSWRLPLSVLLKVYYRQRPDQFGRNSTAGPGVPFSGLVPEDWPHPNRCSGLSFLVLVAFRP